MLMTSLACAWCCPVASLMKSQRMPAPRPRVLLRDAATQSVARGVLLAALDSVSMQGYRDQRASPRPHESALLRDVVVTEGSKYRVRRHPVGPWPLFRLG